MAVSYGTAPRAQHYAKPPIGYGSGYVFPPGARPLLPDDYESELRLHVDFQL
jgi:hypothetical protein